MENTLQTKYLTTDVLIIGGGTAGCYGAIEIADHSDYSVLIVEKAHIKRSGCLAAGVNALNAYITKGKTPEFYVDYAKKDAAGIVREDLLLTMSQGLNRVTKRLEDFGLVILKDENGEYVSRGTRNIKINGENIKPLLAKEVEQRKQISILNHVNVIDYIVEDNRILGAVAVGIDEPVVYIIHAKAVICTTGGAAGLYKPNNPGNSRHKMWYPPFNTGAGFAMGIRAGAEMTTFEMRFIALRCKDTIAPIGTIAQGVLAKQVNAKGDVYEHIYGLTTSERVYGTVKENMEGRGPCYLQTKGITKQQEKDLYHAYLNMAPSQTLKWLESGESPSEYNVEIEGTEPYIVGGHTASGYWVDTKRATTVKGLYAAGDVAGGCPQKYVTGALVEGEIAAHSVIELLQNESKDSNIQLENHPSVNHILKELESTLKQEEAFFEVDQLEEAMQKIMDLYAGGIHTNYQYNEAGLTVAKERIESLIKLSQSLRAKDMYELMKIYELKERLVVCQFVIAHLGARKETRWHSFAENVDYPEKKDEWNCYVNSRLVDGQIEMIYRDLVGREESYEHTY